MSSRLLDLFCCEGGAGMGYHRAGFDVYSVDIEDQPRNPFPFYRGDALVAIRRLLLGEAIPFTHRDGRVEWLTLADFAVVHASPPCQAYSITRHTYSKTHPELIDPTRQLLAATGLPYVIEYFGTSTVREIGDPLSAVLAGAAHHGLAVPPDAFLSKHHGGMDYARIEHMNKSVTEPMPTIVASPNVSLVIPSRKRPDSMYEGELPFELDDVRFRMLGPTEHLRAQRFWEGYDTSAANKSQTTKGAGNAVPVNVAHWIGSEVAEAMAA